MKTKIGIFAGLFVLVATIGASSSFADSNTTILSTNDGIQLTKTVIPMHITSDNILPWAFIEGTVDNHAEGYPVILQIYQNGCLLYTSPRQRDGLLARLPASA